MSTLSVDNINSQVVNSAPVIAGIQHPTAGTLSNRNLVINGAMNFAQRSTSVAAIDTAGYRTCDRFLFNVVNLGTWTVSQTDATNINGVPGAPDGFSHAFRALCTTADQNPAAGDNLSIVYRLEAQDLQHIFTDKSAGDTQPLTLSFWVRSSRTGNASFEILQADNNSRQFTASYNIAAANTWERKVIQIPADDSAVINDDNGTGLQIAWWLNSGITWTGGAHAAVWEASTSANRNASNLGVGAAVNDDFFITGVQLELGRVATPFEHRTFGDELARCQRYCEVLIGRAETFPAMSYSATSASASVRYMVQKRANPTTITLATAGQNAGEISFITASGNYPQTTGTHLVNVITQDSFRITTSDYAGLTIAGNSFLFASGETNVAIVSAEL